MASMDKQSVRDEFDRLKLEFKQIAEKKKINSETKALINGLMMLLELILAIFLEKKTKKTQANSSKPSSQTKKDETTLSKIGANSKGKNEKNTIAGQCNRQLNAAC